jgi:hypothetical protein
LIAINAERAPKKNTERNSVLFFSAFWLRLASLRHGKKQWKMPHKISNSHARSLSLTHKTRIKQTNKKQQQLNRAPYVHGFVVRVRKKTQKKGKEEIQSTAKEKAPFIAKKERNTRSLVEAEKKKSAERRYGEKCL